MKKIFYPKFIFPFSKLVFIIFFILMMAFFIKNLYTKLFISFDFWLLFGAILYLSFIGFVLFHMTFFLCFYYKFIIIQNDIVSIFELKKLKISNVTINEIYGFSKSEVYFGKQAWKSKSIVIYYKNGNKSEIVKSFVFNIDKLEVELKQRKVKYLGFENYQTGWFFRKYKFNCK